MSILIYCLVYYCLLSITLYMVFKKAGQPAWQGLVPILNLVVWCKIIGRPGWWPLLLLVPIVNIFIYASMCVDLVQSFGKYRFLDSFLAVVYLPIPLVLIATDDKFKYEGPNVPAEREYRHALHEARRNNDSKALGKLSKSPFHKNSVREWTESIIFAVFAAAFIRMFLIEAYVIPTPSMEGTLKVGDYLFVSKVHYGVRMPMTVLQFPLLHNRLPILDRESYLRSPSLGYHRMPAIDNVQRFDPVVFNYPEGDSVYVDPDRSVSYMDVQRGNVPYPERYRGKPLTIRPIDKKDHYIKRCIGMPGDSLSIVNKQVFINGKAIENPSEAQYTYVIQSKTPLNSAKLKEWNINPPSTLSGTELYVLTSRQVEQIKTLSADIRVEPITPPVRPTYLFPHDPAITKGWDVDNYGPVYIPKAGATVAITPANLALYTRVIAVYEGNTLSSDPNGQILINGKVATSYTFKQDYYWMMGDNRHNSEDSRVWGFVPADHIVGKPLFIWFSTKDGNIRNGINWDRIFTSARKF